MFVIKITDSITFFFLLVNMLSIKVEESNVKHERLIISGTIACSIAHAGNQLINLFHDGHHAFTNHN